MKIGVVNDETWRFFGPIHDEFSSHHETNVYHHEPVVLPIFQSRINRLRAHRSLHDFLSAHDVVFFEWASGLLAQASHMEKTCGIVTRLHRYELYRWAEQIHWDNVDRIILVSQAKKEEFSGRFPDQAHKIAVIPEAIDLTEFPQSEKSFSGDLGILCHLSPRKRVYELILAFHSLTERDGEFHLHIGGGPHSRYPEYEGILKSLVSRLDLEDQVTFYGPIEDAAGWYRNIDIFISNSYSEGLQVSPMEAMASGCYCLSHWWDGAEELVPSEQLFFTDEDLITKILAFANMTSNEREAILANLRGRVERDFNVARTKEAIRKLAEEAAKPWLR